MPNKIIFYLTYEIDTNRPSGSNIRPMRFLNAFLEMGYEVFLLSGNSKERLKRFKELKINIKNGNKYEYAYCEASNLPAMLTDKDHIPRHPFLDFRILRYLKKMNIKTGLYYRDVYWKFDYLKKQVSFYKYVITYLFHKIELIMFSKNVDVFYVQSIKMLKYLPEVNNNVVKELPPGCDNIKIPEKIYDNFDNINLFYVGGIDEIYKMHKLFAAIADSSNHLIANFCLRPDNWQRVKNEYQSFLKCNRISIVHGSGKMIQKYFEDADVFMFCMEPNEYRNFVLPVKLFEYLSWEKPILGSNGTLVGEFIKKNNIGFVSDYDIKSIKNVLKIIDKNSIAEKKKYILDTKSKNMWSNRITMIESCLKSY